MTDEHKMTAAEYRGGDFFIKKFADADPMKIAEYVESKCNPDKCDEADIYQNLRDAFAAARDGQQVNVEALRDAAQLIKGTYTREKASLDRLQVNSEKADFLAKYARNANKLLAAVIAAGKNKPLTADDMGAARNMMKHAGDPLSSIPDEVAEVARDRRDNELDAAAAETRKRRLSRDTMDLAAEGIDSVVELYETNTRRAAVLYKEIQTLATAVGVNDLPPLESSPPRNTGSDPRSKAR